MSKSESRVFIPIYLKLSAMTILLLAAATIMVSVTAGSMFESMSRRREEDGNRQAAESKGVEVDRFLDSVLASGALAGKALLSGGHEIEISKTLFSATRGTQAVGLVSDGQESRKLFRDDAARTGLEPLLDATFAGFGTPDAAIAPPRSLRAPTADIVALTQSDAKSRLSVLIERESIVSIFSGASEREAFAFSGDGELLSVSASGLNNPAVKRLVDHPAFKDAKVSKFASGQLRYDSDGQKYIGAWYRNKWGIVVVSEATEKVILQPAAILRSRIYYIAGMVIAVSLILVFLFSLSLSTPIEKLVEITKRIAAGDFQVFAAKAAGSHDEVGILAGALDSMALGLAERDKVKGLFQKFHGSSVAETVMSDDVALGGGKRKPVVVFFSDIRGFTSFSETRQPEEVVAMLNEYFKAMVAEIHASGGVVDKFIGDAIMAVWGSPKSSPKDELMALQCCLRIRKRLVSFNAERIKKGEKPILIGMGLHAGEAISGTIGSDDRMEFTVIGDTVNLASRIEASTKSFGTDLLVSESLRKKCAKAFLFEAAGSVAVKGKKDPLTLYRVNGFVNKEGKQITLETPYSKYKAEGDDKVKVQK